MHLYINFLRPLPGSAKDMVPQLKQLVSKFISANAPSLLKELVDEIQLRFLVGEGTEVMRDATRNESHHPATDSHSPWYSGLNCILYCNAVYCDVVTPLMNSPI